MIGKEISHYKILERIGGGGMGVIYKAEDTKLKRLVALKFLPPAFATDPTTKERFLHEAQAASALQHNNICNIFEIGESEDGQLFISMAYYEGQTLRDKLKSGKINIYTAIDYIIRVAQGLQKAHEKGIIHRDIKPANIMITSDGEPKILDFGLAKLPAGSVITDEKSTLGTIFYLSPEMIEGKEVDHRTDIWSLGIVLYEMITGKLPFQGDYDSAIMYTILNEAYEPVSKSLPGGPEELDVVISKCLEKNPNDRYQHVDDLIVDLRKLKRDSEPKIKIPKTDTIIKTSAKNKKPVLMSILILLSIIIVVVGYLFKNKFIHSDKPESESRDAVQWENSIAVLPFVDLSPNKDQEYFCDGMTDQIITNLTKLNKLKVTARTSVNKFRDTNKTAPEIGNELQVENILEGSIFKSGESVRITAQLINASNGSHIWAETYDRDLKNLFVILDDVSKSIAGMLLAKLSETEVVGIQTQKPSNIDAYEYYLKGNY